MSYKLIVTIVPQYSGELITNTARDSGCPGGTVLMGTETSANGLVQLLGFGDAPKDITYNLTQSTKAPAIISAIKDVTGKKKKNFGLLFSIEVDDFIKAGDEKPASLEKGEKKMTDNNYEMINVIVNKGYAEDAMAAARKAGAGGGTIIQAHGTAKEGDAKFFGSEIVPEKDMLVILVPKDKKEAIVNAVKELNCFKKAGSGIIFCNEIKDFTILGKN
ncbi:MAG: transcriptional regulator [Treponema sp.]|uniref:P-II family nitrogen regulator n=1 Tax=Treponema sp. TaxID=166 RepID=UPI001B763F79|nr:P-II family nitrogen regulator [Treponema sp.]MBP5587800.1 transcriptional regulator [Treponema sp.]MBR0155386.1 transcriptional regulator [Treponema sp.]